jgi:hypothetical protein
MLFSATGPRAPVPSWNRSDIHIEVLAVEYRGLTSHNGGDSFEGQIKRFSQIDDASQGLLKAAIDKLEFSYSRAVPGIEY